MKPKKSSKPKKAKTTSRRDPTYGGLLHVSTQAKRRAKTSEMESWMVTAAILVAGGVALVALLWVGTGWAGRLLFTENDHFLLREISARSDGVLPEGLLREWAGVSTGQNLFQVPLGEVRERLEKNPIIRRAVVRRRLPGVLEIEVSERVAIARMGQVEGHMNWLVDDEGVLIRKSLHDKHLPFLLGVPPNVTLGDTIAGGRGWDALRYLKVLRDLPAVKRDLFEVQVISVGHPDYLDVRLASGFRILLPRDRDHQQVLEMATFHVDRELRLPEAQRRNEFDLTPRGNHVIGVRR